MNVIDGLRVLRERTGFTERPGQTAMALAIEGAITTGRHLMIEAPTGVGKSVAYLVPAIAHAVESRKPVIVVVPTRALLHQLVDKDLPLLQQVLPVPFTFALRKGMANYACHRAIRKPSQSLRALPVYGQINEWLNEEDIGDRESFLPGKAYDSAWSEVAANPDECIGSKCEYRVNCFYKSASHKAKKADIIVTTSALFMRHLLVCGLEEKKDIILPQSDVIIIDEAHKLADEARRHSGFDLSHSMVRHLVARSNLLDMKIGRTLIRASENFFERAAAHQLQSKGRRLKTGHPLSSAEVVSCLEVVGEYLRNEITATDDDEAKGPLEKRWTRCQTMMIDFEGATGNEKGWVTAISLAPTIRLETQPIKPAGWLKRNLFERFTSVILTSATLAPAGSFALQMAETGYSPTDQCLRVSSPFDLKHQSRLVIPSDLPTYGEPNYARSIIAMFVRICHVAKGRTLGLFTSRERCNEAYEALLASRPPFAVHHQNTPRSVEAFRSDVNSVLVGVKSLWEGVDISGPACSVVVIDKIPFLPIDDPITDALEEMGARPFYNRTVPLAVIDLLQGCGRLVRSEKDRGVIVILDARLRGKHKRILRMLPYDEPGTSIDEIPRFLDAEEKV